jgi:hypothetical protein
VIASQSTAAQRMQVTVQGTGSPLVSQTLSVFAQGTGSWYTPQSLTFVANSSQTTLTFQDVSQTTVNIDLLLDNVRVTLQNAPAVTAQLQSVAVQSPMPISNAQNRPTVLNSFGLIAFPKNDPRRIKAMLGKLPLNGGKMPLDRNLKVQR